jgi:hypothetical protein
MTAVLVALLLAACSVGLSKAEALEIAREAAPRSADFPVFVAKAGPAGELVGNDTRFAVDVPGDRWVWYVVLDTGALSGEGSMIVIDYLDGRVYEVVDIVH